MDYKKNHNNMEFQFPNGNGCISANIANRLFKRNIRNWDEAMVGKKKKTAGGKCRGGCGNLGLDTCMYIYIYRVV